MARTLSPSPNTRGTRRTAAAKAKQNGAALGFEAKLWEADIGRRVDRAMAAIERENPSLQGVLPKDYARPTLDQHTLGELIDLVATIGLGDAESRSKDVLGRVFRGIEGNLGPSHADTFRHDLHPDLKADFILANPPFNVSDWKGELLREDLRWRYGVPPAGNANFAWVQHIIHHLAPNGVAGFVLANGSMSSNQSGEGEIRTYHAWRGQAEAGAYEDVPGFCKSVTTWEIEAHGFVLTPGRYVGTAAQGDDGEPFAEKMARLTRQLADQFAESARLEQAIRENLRGLGYDL